MDSLDSQGLDQIQKMGFVQTEKSRRSRSIAVCLRKRSYDDVSFSDLQSLAI